LNGSAISKIPDHMPCIGLAISAFPHSAAIVSAATQMNRTPSGNFPNSLNAAFTYDTGRALRVSAIRHSLPSITFMLSYLTTAVKGEPQTNAG
jgi:hypothetical protein